jgi:HEAT repeat protein
VVVFKRPESPGGARPRVRRHLRRGLCAALCAALGLCPSLPSPGGERLTRAFAPGKPGAFGVAQTADPAARGAQLFSEARVFLENEDWAAAAAKFEEFIGAHPRDRNVEAALYWLAVSLKKQQKFQGAEQALARLTKEFPQSAWASSARVMRVEIAAATGDRQVIEAGLADEDEDVLLVALQSLFRVEPARAVAFTAGALKPGSGVSPQVKLTAVALLGTAGGGQATALLIDTIRQETDQKLRKAAVYALGRGRDPNALEFLKGLVTRGVGDEMAKTAAFAIAQLPGARPSEFLGELARASRSPEMRRNALTWLAQQDTEAAVGELVSTFDAAREEEIKNLSLLALGQATSSRAWAKLVEVARRDGPPQIRMHAILGLGLRGEDRALASLIELYDEETAETVKEWVLAALGQAGQKIGLRKLMDVARSDQSQRLRQAALESLGRASGDPEVGRFLREQRR